MYPKNFKTHETVLNDSLLGIWNSFEELSGDGARCNTVVDAGKSSQLLRFSSERGEFYLEVQKALSVSVTSVINGESEFNQLSLGTGKIELIAVSNLIANMGLTLTMLSDHCFNVAFTTGDNKRPLITVTFSFLEPVVDSDYPTVTFGFKDYSNGKVVENDFEFGETLRFNN